MEKYDAPCRRAFVFDPAQAKLHSDNGGNKGVTVK